ncbi:unnamed protein product [Gongylonema pulchrum]|uniref:Probable methylmalonate-semialdehyde/malonate-semialdehyde dehydrogenase [acylating], mitochondrial n=1 Tax=Gongylonema pulchrum TaxID=637853 RepID=A0A183ETA7_9BILA|nr:unnamed protein product [Gongylonema pulchrum]
MIWYRVIKLQGLKGVHSAYAFSTSRAALASTAETVKMWIDGKRVESKPSHWTELTNSATGEVIGRVPQCTQEEMQRAVDSAKKAFKTWGKSSPIMRTQCMYNLRNLIKRDIDKLAECITTEHGKTLAESKGEINRGLQVITVEFTMS